MQDYGEATNQAGIALRIRQGDQVATKQLEEGNNGLKMANQQLVAFQAATNAAAAALRRQDYGEATNQAGIALRIRREDPVASKQLDEGNNGLKMASQTQANFEEAIKAAEDAIGSGKYVMAISQAKSALKFRANDPTALKLIASAKIKFGEAHPPRTLFGVPNFDFIWVTNVGDYGGYIAVNELSTGQYQLLLGLGTVQGATGEAKDVPVELERSSADSLVAKLNERDSNSISSTNLNLPKARWRFPTLAEYISLAGVSETNGWILLDKDKDQFIPTEETIDKLQKEGEYLGEKGNVVILRHVGVGETRHSLRQLIGNAREWTSTSKDSRFGILPTADPKVRNSLRWDKPQQGTKVGMRLVVEPTE
jgi:hypothetical protein